MSPEESLRPSTSEPPSGHTDNPPTTLSSERPSTLRSEDDFQNWFSAQRMPGGFDDPSEPTDPKTPTSLPQISTYVPPAVSDGSSDLIPAQSPLIPSRSEPAQMMTIPPSMMEDAPTTKQPAGQGIWSRWGRPSTPAGGTTNLTKSVTDRIQHSPAGTESTPHPLATATPSQFTPAPAAYARPTESSWWDRATSAWSRIKSAPRRYITDVVDRTYGDCTDRIKWRIQDDLAAARSAIGTGAQICAALTLGCLALNVAAGTAIKVCDAYDAIAGTRRTGVMSGRNTGGWSTVPSAGPWGSPYFERDVTTEPSAALGWTDEGLSGAGGGFRSLLRGTHGTNA